MSNTMTWDASLLPELLPLYYKKLFPYSQFYKWLRYKESGPQYFKNREFSFTLRDDIYLRFKSFADQADMEKEIKAKCPYKIDIGAIYTVAPKMREMVRAGEFVAQYKELVFDIDMTDYDDVRFCCSGADICLKCWPLMTVAIKILHRSLTEDFGFKHVLWVYSGRRGVHCWVCDEKARKLSVSARTAIADYLSIVKGGANMKKKVILKFKNNHPSIEESVYIISNYFSDYVISQDLLGTDERVQMFRDLVSDEEVKKALEVCHGDKTEVTWRTIKENYIKSLSEPPDMVCTHAELHDMPNNMKEIMLQYMYPRLDVNVSKGVNHLLKSPFCIHPKTGRVCVPIDVDKVDSFNPFEVPTLVELTEELGEWSGDANLLAYKKTSLRAYIETFDKFLKSLTGENLPAKANVKAEDMTIDVDMRETAATF